MSVKRIIAELPYPSTDGLTTDLESVSIISPAYAAPGKAVEMTASLQYIYQHFMFKKYKMDDIADTLEGIAIAEMMHLDYLGTMIAFMGGPPVYRQRPLFPSRFYNAENVKYYTEPKRMIAQDIQDEIDAINLYKHMLTQLKNQRVAAVISRIILDEKLHLQIFKEILEKL